MGDAAPAVPAEVAEIQAKIAAQGGVVKDLKTRAKEGGDGAPSEEEVKAAVAELLALKASLPAEFQEKKDDKKKKKKEGGGAAQAERERKKEEKRRQREEAAKAKQLGDSDTQPGVLTDTYGDLPLAQSRDEDRQRRTWTRVSELNVEKAGKPVLIRGYVHNCRVQARAAFIVVRQSFATVQVVVSDAKMLKWCTSLSAESVVDIEGDLVEVPKPTKATQSLVEIQAKKLFVVNRASKGIAFQVTDCDHTASELKAAAEANEKLKAEGKEEKAALAVGQDLKLQYRHLSLRSPYQAAIMRVSSGVCHFFREFLNNSGFIEIQTPKLLGGQSESGSEVFLTDYFGNPACLAQSPQLHKQITAACAGLERVFEIGPVFRAENSNTNRHLCEFHGLDMEMAFNEHYHEVLDVFSDLFHYIFNSLNEKYATEIALIREYCDVEPLVFEPSADLEGIKTVGTTSRTLLLTFQEGIAMLREDGVTAAEQGDLEDMSTEYEKRLGRLVKEKYGVDWYMLDKFPAEFRPFYTMPDPNDPLYSNSYDFFIRGQEILSGAQRVHDPDMLSVAVAKKGVSVESLSFYINAFKDGALPHGGGGIGLERVVMLFLGLPNIRQACFFVRDPQRLTP
mmetsp:Transcript_1954/g.3161  ORF Transcript_1954/g.3161 Transcript_1954/m.3161 type:complete len:622 (+) Transcript_1954:150-2015(+)